MAALLVRRKEDGEVFGVGERHYEYLTGTDLYEDGGSTALLDSVPLNDEMDLPKLGPLQEAGYDTVGDLRAASLEDLQDVEGVGESTAEEIMAALE